MSPWLEVGWHWEASGSGVAHAVKREPNEKGRWHARCGATFFPASGGSVETCARCQNRVQSDGGIADTSFAWTTVSYPPKWVDV